MFRGYCFSCEGCYHVSRRPDGLAVEDHSDVCIIGISQTFSTTENYRYLPCWSAFRNHNISDINKISNHLAMADAGRDGSQATGKGNTDRTMVHLSGHQYMTTRLRTHFALLFSGGCLKVMSTSYHEKEWGLGKKRYN